MIFFSFMSKSLSKHTKTYKRVAGTGALISLLALSLDAERPIAESFTGDLTYRFFKSVARDECKQDIQDYAPIPISALKRPTDFFSIGGDVHEDNKKVKSLIKLLKNAKLSDHIFIHSSIPGGDSFAVAVLMIEILQSKATVSIAAPEIANSGGLGLLMAADHAFVTQDTSVSIPSLFDGGYLYLTSAIEFSKPNAPDFVTVLSKFEKKLKEGADTQLTMENWKDYLDKDALKTAKESKNNDEFTMNIEEVIETAAFMFIATNMVSEKHQLSEPCSQFFAHSNKSHFQRASHFLGTTRHITHIDGANLDNLIRIFGFSVFQQQKNRTTEDDSLIESWIFNAALKDIAPS